MHTCSVLHGYHPLMRDPVSARTNHGSTSPILIPNSMSVRMSAHTCSSVQSRIGSQRSTWRVVFVLAVVWDYLWFVLNPAYTVRRFRRGNVWWFEVPWIWRFPLDYYLSILLSIGLVLNSARGGEHVSLY